MPISLSRAVVRVAVASLFAASSLATMFVSRADAGTDATFGKTAANAHVIANEKTALAHETRALYASTPMRLPLAPTSASEPRQLLAFAPSTSGEARAMTVVYLHGVNGKAENGCPWFRGGASELGWLVCPEGVEHAANGTASWGGDVFKQNAAVASALRAAEARGASAEPGVAVGFSQGGYVALDLVKAHLGHFRGLVLLAAPEAHPSAQKLRDAGVVRVALGAGSLDAAYAPLVEDTRRLQREGIEARFFDLGPVGHTYAAEDTNTLREAIAWAGGLRDSRE